MKERLGGKVDPVTKEVLNPYFDTKAFQSLPTQFMVSPEPPVFEVAGAVEPRGGPDADEAVHIPRAVERGSAR